MRNRAAYLCLVSVAVLIGCDGLSPSGAARAESVVTPVLKLGKGLSVGDIDSAVAVVRGDSIADSLVFLLAINHSGGKLVGTLRMPPEGSRWTIAIRLYDSQKRLIGCGLEEATATTLQAGTLFMNVSSVSALPKITALTAPDSVGLNDQISLSITAVDSFSGAITRWAWKIGESSEFGDCDSGDTLISAPGVETLSLPCYARVTDNDGNTFTDSIMVSVVVDSPQVVFLTGDTVLPKGGVVRCSFVVMQRFGSYTVQVDHDGSGAFGTATAVDPAVERSFIYEIATGATNSWDSVVVRVVNDDGIVRTQGFKVDIMPAPVTLESIDTTMSSVTVHFTGSTESDFAAYRIYRADTPDVDSSGKAWATDTAASSTSYAKTHEFDFARYYYRVFVVDSEGAIGPGSNVLSARIINSPPNKPRITVPSGSFFYTAGVSLEWSGDDPNDQPLSYIVDTSWNNRPYSRMGVYTQASTLFLCPTGLAEAGVHDSADIRVMAIDSEGDSSAWSDGKRLYDGDASQSTDGIVVISPNGGETFAVGSDMHIKWSAGDDIQNVEIAISTDEKTFHSILSTSIAKGEDSWGDYAWTIPDTIGGASVASTTCKIRIRQYGVSNSDLSDGVFTITQ